MHEHRELAGAACGRHRGVVLHHGTVSLHDPAARDDVAASVLPPHEPLVAAVVVGGEELERRGPAVHRARLVAGRVDAAPEPHEHVLVPLRPDRGRIGVARVDARLGRELHEDVHDRVVQALVAVSHRAADRAVEEDVGREAVGAVHEERQVPRAVAGREERGDPEVAGGHLVAVRERAVDAGHAVGLERVRQHLEVEAAGVRVGLGDVVGVGVGDEQVRTR